MKVTIDFIDGDSTTFKCEESKHCQNGLEKFNINTSDKLKVVAYPVNRIKSIIYESDDI